MSDAFEPIPEPLADELAAKLHTAGHEAWTSGRKVQVAAGDARSVSVSCWDTGGADYDVYLRRRDGIALAMGWTRDVDEVVRAIDAWSDGLEVDALVAVVPFIERERRELRAFAAAMPEGVHTREHSTALRVDAAQGARHGWIESGRRGMSCTFTIDEGRRAQVGPGGDLHGAVRAWLIDRCGEGDLAARVPGIELLELSEWKWRRLLDDSRDPRSHRIHLVPLLTRLVASQIVRRFYPVMSLDRLGFSASSAYPFVTDGLPVIEVEHEGQPFHMRLHRVGGERTLETITETIEAIEDVLVAYPIAPFVGSAPDRPHEDRR